MMNVARALFEQFLRRSATELLIFGVGISFIDFALLFLTASKEGVLHISQGVGLLNHYGIFSTLLGNSIGLYAAKKYYDAICSMEHSAAVVKTAPIRRPLTKLESMIKMEEHYPHIIYVLVIVGALFCVANASIHLFGNAENWWGSKVFDSRDHLLSFLASRLHNLYTWIIILPFVGHVMTCATCQLRRAMAITGALKYDLLNPDQRGGFGFVDRAHIAFIIIAALAYIQITTHILTFKLNPEHIVGYVGVTLLLLGINTVFLGNVYATIRKLRLKALNEMKNKVLMDDKLSFEILKYCYERKLSPSTVVVFVIKAAALVGPGIIRLWPNITKVLTAG